jgi:hypothetical protein
MSDSSMNLWYRDRTSDLKNVTLRILVVEHPPSVIKYIFPDGYVRLWLQIFPQLENE